MPCIEVLGPYEFTLNTLSTTAAFYPLPKWLGAVGLSSVDFAMNLEVVSGNIEVKPGVQLATVRSDKPDNPQAITAGSYQSAVDTYHYRETISTTTKFLARFGLMYKLSTGSSLGTAQVKITLYVKQCGDIVGTRKFDINPFMDLTDASAFSVSQWLPTVGITGLEAVILAMDNQDTNLETMLMVRTAIDPNKPNSWQNVEAAWNNPSSGNSERNTGELSPPTGANFSSNSLFQLGIAVRKKSGAGNPRATLQIACAIKR